MTAALKGGARENWPGFKSGMPACRFYHGPQGEPVDCGLFCSGVKCRRKVVGQSVRTLFPAGHVVHMSLDHDKTPSDSLARCDCGWENRVAWLGHHSEQDAAIEQHWQEVERGNAG